MKKRTKILIAIFSVLFLIIGLVAFTVIYTNNSLTPTKAFLNGEICEDGIEKCEITPFVVDYGAYGKSTLVKLEEEGIIKNANIAYYYNRIFGGYSFCAGYFEIPHEISNRAISLDEIMAFLANPKNAHQGTTGFITFDEGDWIRNYAKIIADKTSVTEKELMSYWNNEEVIRGYMDEYPFLTEEMFNPDVKYLLEGYLFPDTYEFNEYTNCDEVTRTFLDRTLDIYEKYQEEFDNSKYSIHQIFTLASMVQWETGTVEENKYVAGVFLNRLENPDYEDIQILGSTVTACYAFDLTKEQCAIVGDNTDYTWRDHPYNTYTNMGLPPGPVCNPNEISIEGVLYADQSDGYYYFIGDTCYGSGTIFAKTARQHEYNISKYILCN